jgi:hypothetical protein
MNENYYIGIDAFRRGMGISEAMITVTEESKLAYDSWFAGYNQASFDERWNRLHKKSERWWLEK